MKQLKTMKENKFINNKLYYYLKPTNWSVPRVYAQPKIHKPGVHIRPIVSYSDSHCIISTNTQLTFCKLMLKMKIITPRILPRFATTSEMLPLNMMR